MQLDFNTRGCISVRTKLDEYSKVVGHGEYLIVGEKANISEARLLQHLASFPFTGLPHLILQHVETVEPDMGHV